MMWALLGVAEPDVSSCLQLHCHSYFPGTSSNLTLKPPTAPSLSF